MAMNSSGKEMLDNILAALQQQEAEAAQREKGGEANALPAPPPLEQDEAWQTRLHQWNERLMKLGEAAQVAAQEVQEVEAALQAEEEALRVGLAALQTVGNRLTDWDRRYVA